MDKYEGVRKAFNEWDCFRTLGSFDNLSTQKQENYLNFYNIIYDEGKTEGYTESENDIHMDDDVLIDEAGLESRENMRGEVEEKIQEALDELQGKTFNLPTNKAINQLKIDVLTKIMREVEEL